MGWLSCRRRGTHGSEPRDPAIRRCAFALVGEMNFFQCYLYLRYTHQSLGGDT